MKTARPQKTETSVAAKPAHSNAAAELFPDVQHPHGQHARGTLIMSGQCAQGPGLISGHQPILSFEPTAGHAIPEATTRRGDLRTKSLNTITQIQPEIDRLGRVLSHIARYSIGCTERISLARML